LREHLNHLYLHTIASNKATFRVFALVILTSRQADVKELFRKCNDEEDFFANYKNINP
jgi:hypothetical protein